MDINTVIINLQANVIEKEITLFPAATDEDIIAFETTLSVKLPADIKTFYKFSDGLKGEWMFRIIPLKDILYEVATYNDQYNANHMPIAEYMIFSDEWTLRLDEKHPNEYYIQRESDGKLVTKSFTDFLNRYIIYGLHGDEGLGVWYETDI